MQSVTFSVADTFSHSRAVDMLAVCRIFAAACIEYLQRDEGVKLTEAQYAYGTVHAHSPQSIPASIERIGYSGTHHVIQIHLRQLKHNIISVNMRQRCLTM